MSFEHPLRGSCACRRNQYFIKAPKDAVEAAQVLFGTGSSHRIAQATPLSAHIRVPLEWYHAATISLFPDETASMIRRVYENPFEGHTRRHFCGFCGTPLTYWSEQPRGEADYIQITMGSLCRDDLGDLDDLGLIPESPTEGQSPVLHSSGSRQSTEGGGAVEKVPVVTSSSDLQSSGDLETTGIPWFDTIIEGSNLAGRLKTTKGLRQSADGTTRVEWEIVEYTGDGNEPNVQSGNNGKRKLGDRDDVDDAQMGGVSQ